MSPRVVKDGFGAEAFSGWTLGGNSKGEAMTACASMR
jgi:hypothetical protein